MGRFVLSTEYEVRPSIMTNAPKSSDVTGLLARLTCGDRQAVDLLMPAVYRELHEMAQRQLATERPDHTLQPTALVHEAYLRLVDQRDTEWKSRAHFLAVASQIIRRILIDHARAHRSHKRGSGRKPLDIASTITYSVNQPTDLLDIHESLERLASRYPEKARLVEMRFFGGLTNEESAEVLGVTTRTVERQLQFAKAWLYRDLGGL